MINSLKVTTIFNSYLTENNLTGSIPRWTMMNAKILDVSYNNFTYDDFGPKTCDRWPINDIHPCLMKDFPCNKPNEHIHSLHINCGGEEVTINNTIIYKADTERIGASSYYNDGNWAFSSTGNFLDDDRASDAYILFNKSDLHSIPTSDTELYTTARTAGISLTYYGLCLVNGNYNVTLHFAEIVFTQDESRDSLGKRVFNVYVQGDLKLKDFDIVNVAGGTGIAVIRSFKINVKNNTLKIQLYWAGKGTTGIPFRGSYGPIISAISVEPYFVAPHCGKRMHAGLIDGIVGGVCVVLLIMCILWRRGYKMTKNQLIETGHLSTSTSFS
ncbi:putative LRR receptor-like serine/threonine-protein kinase At1g07650 [Bidens hawaiensis]|uniref:putative LRR receptor-like serine/threonine-protein kinase At1g07650 n=1 Tax=Bidens hawaiensis TaxID=980011 RepID=UPI00404AEBD5